MKKGIEPAFPISEVTTGNYGESIVNTYFGMSIRLKIASDAMCALIGQCHGLPIQKHNIELINKTALLYAENLIKMEEETRDEDRL